MMNEEDRRQSKHRSQETPEQREQGLAKRRERDRQRRARETSEEREQKLARRREDYREC